MSNVNVHDTHILLNYEKYHFHDLLLVVKVGQHSAHWHWRSQDFSTGSVGGGGGKFGYENGIVLHIKSHY